VRDNHVVWNGTQLVGFLYGTNVAPSTTLKIKSPKESTEDAEEVPNPAYDMLQA
jgi:hypothetical protein